jgi:hypothetical protein
MALAITSLHLSADLHKAPPESETLEFAVCFNALAKIGTFLDQSSIRHYLSTCRKIRAILPEIRKQFQSELREKTTQVLPLKTIISRLTIRNQESLRIIVPYLSQKVHLKLSALPQLLKIAAIVEANLLRPSSFAIAELFELTKDFAKEKPYLAIAFAQLITDLQIRNLVFTEMFNILKNMRKFVEATAVNHMISDKDARHSNAAKICATQDQYNEAIEMAKRIENKHTAADVLMDLFQLFLSLNLLSDAERALTLIESSPDMRKDPHQLELVRRYIVKKDFTNAKKLAKTIRSPNYKKRALSKIKDAEPCLIT